MPGKSKKGGGLTSSPVYKKQAYGTAKSPFMMKKSPAKQVKGNMPKNFNIKGGSGSGTPGVSSTKIAKANLAKNTSMATSNLIKFKNLAKVGKALTGVASLTALAIPLALESFTKESVKRKKAGLSGFNISKSKKNKGFNFKK